MTKRCSRCGQCLPLTCFRRRSKGSNKPHADCRECNRMDQRRRRVEKTGKVFRRLASDVHQYRGSSIDRIALLVGTTMDHFGGLDRFVRAFKRTFNRAMTQGDLTLAFRILRMVMELMLAIEKERNRIDQETEDAATPDELCEDMNRHFVAMLVEHGESEDEARKLAERILSARTRARTREDGQLMGETKKSGNVDGWRRAGELRAFGIVARRVEQQDGAKS